MKAVLIYPIKNNKILLGLKQQKVSAGLFSGYGGKQKKEETMTATALREFFEETGKRTICSAKDFEPVAIINFSLNYSDKESFSMRVFCYTLSYFLGELKDNDEMKNHTWFSFDKIPYKKMLPDYQVFLPKILRGEKFIGEIVTKDNKILKNKFQDVSSGELSKIFKEN